MKLAQIELVLDSRLKKTVEDLFVVSAQAPALGLEGGTLREDGFAIFRIAKEFSLTIPHEEKRPVDAEDIARLLRFTAWVLSYGGNPVFHSNTSRARDLRALFASVSLQAQAEFSGFESLLKSFGVDRQLEAHPPRAQSAAAKSAGLDLKRIDRTHEVKVKVDANGAELTHTTTESTWSASGWKQESST